MKNRSYLFLFLFIFFLTFHTQAQNGWTRKANGFYSQVTTTTFSSDQYYTLNNDLSTAGNTFNSKGLLLFGEYGISNRLTAALDVPLVMLNNFNTTETVGGIGNVKLGLKYKLLKNFPLSFQADVEIPTDDGLNFATTKQANEIGIFEQINLPTSDGEFNFWTTLAASQSTSSGKTFASIFASINFRTEGFSHQFQSGIEIGHLFFDKLYLIGKFKIQENLSDELSSSGSFLYGEGTTFTSYNLTTMYKLDKHWKIIASFSDFSDAIVKRRNIYDGATFSLGVALEY